MLGTVAVGRHNDPAERIAFVVVHSQVGTEPGTDAGGQAGTHMLVRAVEAVPIGQGIVTA